MLPWNILQAADQAIYSKCFNFQCEVTKYISQILPVQDTITKEAAALILIVTVYFW